MTKDNVMRLHRIFNIAVAVSMGIAGICLILGCLRIYYDYVPATLPLFGREIPFFSFVGANNYSREMVADTFRYIAIPVCIALVLAVGSFVFEFLSPMKKGKEKAEVNYAYQIKKLSAKKNLSEADRSVVRSIAAERRTRIILAIVRVVLLVQCSAGFLIYGANPANFHTTEISDSMIGAMLWLCPFLVVSGGFCIFVEYFNRKSMYRQISLLKKIPDAKEKECIKKPSDDALLVKNIIKYVFIISLALALIAAGIYMGGTADVLTKAINICTECIGLG